MENQINNPANNADKMEVRYSTELRADSNDSVIRGTAIVFDSPSVLLYDEFREVIKPQAVTKEFLDTQNITMLYNHSENFGILARSKQGKGTLKCSVDDHGVNFEFKAKRKDAGIVESIACGDIEACSFAFRVSPEPGSETWEKQTDGKYLRTISKFEAIADMSLVINAAYPATSVDTRGLDLLKEKERREQQTKEGLEKDKKERQDEEERNKKHQEYLQKLKNKYLK